MKPLLPVLALLLLTAPASLRGQVSLHIDLGLPVAPPLVVVQPGVQVVEDFDDEVFFVNGWYWCRRPNGWYRARTPRAHFDFVEVRRVPRRLVRMPEGHYRRWHHDPMIREQRRAHMEPRGPQHHEGRGPEPHEGRGPERREVRRPEPMEHKDRGRHEGRPEHRR